MLVFDYLIRLYNQDVSVGASPATGSRGSAGAGLLGGDLAGAGSVGGDSTAADSAGVGTG
jgi:hypothetical protein